MIFKHQSKQNLKFFISPKLNLSWIHNYFVVLKWLIQEHRIQNVFSADLQNILLKVTNQSPQRGEIHDYH